MSGYRKGRRYYGREFGQPKKHQGKNTATIICPACGKVSYATRQEAKAAARRLYPGDRMRSYRCGTWYHITSQDTEAVTRYRRYRQQDAA